jgi:hypothetical protein
MHWCSLDIAGIRVTASLRARSAEEIEATKVGEFHADSCSIWVAAELPRDLAKATLLHEIGHAILYLFGVTIDDEDEEERWVNLISSLVFDVLTRNGMLHLPEPPVA